MFKGLVRQGVTFLLAFTLLASSFQSVLAAEAASDEGGVNGTQEESSEISAVDESSMVNGHDSTETQTENNDSTNEDSSNGDSDISVNESDAVSDESSTPEGNEESRQNEDSIPEKSPSVTDESSTGDLTDVQSDEALVDRAYGVAEVLFEPASQNLLTVASMSLFSIAENSDSSRMGLRDGISFRKLITDENKYPDQNNVQYLVIHDTGNTNKGATAINHYYYFLNNVGRSAHYFVDDHEVIQIIEDKDGAWHCGDGKGQYGITNTNSLSIETCVNSDGNYEEAIQNTIDLAAYLMYTYNLPMDRLVRHYDASRKNCPAQMNQDGQWTDWYNFKAAVAAKLKTYGPSSSDPGEEEPEEPSEEAPGRRYTSILGESEVSASELIDAIVKVNPDFNPEIAEAYIEIGAKYGVRGDIAICQAILETGWFKYGGQVPASSNNFCGLKTSKTQTETEEFAVFATPQEGVEAHIQHLYAYATTKDLPEGTTLVDPRFQLVNRGCATSWEDLSGRWAVPGYSVETYANMDEAREYRDSYGDKIVKLYEKSMNGVVDGETTDTPGQRPILQQGSLGIYVKELQTLLNQWGYTCDVDGSFGPATLKNVKAFQTDHGLSVTGVVDAATWNKLLETPEQPTEPEQPAEPEQPVEPEQPAEPEQPVEPEQPSTSNPPDVSGKPVLTKGKTGSAVRELQTLLNQKGFACDVDGSFGPATLATVKAFQAANGLAVDGSVGPATWTALLSGSNGSSTTTPTTPTTPEQPSTSNPPDVSGKPVLRKGKTGSAVRELQTLLNQKGFACDVDGSFGPATLAAVKAFQAANGLAVDGSVGPATWTALLSGSSSSGTTTTPSTTTSSSSASSKPVLRKGKTGSAVRELQTILRNKGYNISVDGSFGPATLAAVKAFQAANGLVVDGSVGPATWAALLA